MNRRTPAIASDGFLKYLLLDPKMPNCFFALLDSGTWVHFALHPETGDYYEIRHERPYTLSFFERVLLRRMSEGSNPIAFLRDLEEPRRTFVIVNNGKWSSIFCMSSRCADFFGDPSY
jgi:hypothetical protein